MAVGSRHTVPGQMAGYLFQPERALYWLVNSCSGSRIGIETEDDIVVQEPSGQVIREQDKHSISNLRPLSDGSIAFWKTLNIWVEAIGEEKHDTSLLRLYFATNTVVEDGSLLKRIASANDDDDALECVHALRDLARSTNQSTNRYTDGILGQPDEVLTRLVRLIDILDCSQSTDEVKAQIISALHIPPELPQEDIVESLLGWVCETTLSLWRAGHPAWLTRDAFDRRYTRSVAQYQRREFVETARSMIKVSDSDRLANRDRVFVRQLILLRLTSEDEEILDAIDDFIRCHTERIRLSREGMLTALDLRSFDDRLEERWKTIFRKTIRIRGKANAEDLGYDIMQQTLDHREMLAGHQTMEFYLTKGSYHMLADELKVGWHPRYERILSEEVPSSDR